tara:strand:- start:966 stop:1676 length:711 start_codon:yes stop_codon:yes gene_type:complete
MIENLNELKNADIKLVDPGHRYVLGSNKKINFQSVTEIVDEQFEPFDKVRIATKLVKIFHKYREYTVESLIDEWDSKRDRGSYIHKELENYIEKGIQPDSSRGSIGAEWFDNNIADYGDKIFTEIIVFDEKLKIAGTIDLLVFDSKKNNCYLFDWKTNEKIDYEGYRGQTGITSASYDLDDCRYSKYSLQTSLYKYILEKRFNIILKDTYLIHLTPYHDVDIIRTDYLEDNLLKMI